MRRGKEPYLPLHLFTNIRYMAAAWNNGLGACVYYGFSIVVPQVVNNVWYARGEISEYDIGTLAGLTAMGFVFAQICHGFVEWITGKSARHCWLQVACQLRCPEQID